jgi:trans-aconitate methyltransferase
MPSVEEYEERAKCSALRDIRVWGENADRFFPDKDTMISWIDQPSLVPLLAYVAEGDKAAFREYVIERMIDETLQDDGRCFETFRRINIFARK